MGDQHVGPRAFIAVPTQLLHKVLEEGYICTHREHVPCHFGPREEAVRAFKHMHSNQEKISVIDVIGIDATLLEQDSAYPGGGKILLKHLPKENLQMGAVAVRGEHGDGTTMPCPFCGNAISVVDDDRRTVGVANYCDDGDNFPYYVGSRCCPHEWKARQQRLNSGEKKILYHMTSRTVADSIMASGRMRRGGHGNAGAGMYFAETKRETEWKAVPAAAADSTRVLLECEVRLGEVREEFHKSETDLIPELQSIVFADMMRFQGNEITTVKDDNVTKKQLVNPPGPKDSLYLKRGMSKYGKSGDEVIVYSWDQVTPLREVDRDPL